MKTKKEATKFFDSIITGLDQAIDYEKGNLKGVKTRKESITPVPFYSGKKIKQIRNKIKLSQVTFAKILGVSLKTVEAWEAGRNNPAGPAQRIIGFLDKDSKFLEKYNILATGK